MTNPIFPDLVREAIRAGHVTEVVIFCDSCGARYPADHIGVTSADRFAAARRHLTTKGWTITPGEDLCPDCPTADPPADLVQEADLGARCQFCGDVVIAATNAAGRVVAWIGGSGEPRCPTTDRHHNPAGDPS